MGFITSCANGKYSISVCYTRMTELLYQGKESFYANSIEEATVIVMNWIDKGIYPLSYIDKISLGVGATTILEPKVETKLQEENNA